MATNFGIVLESFFDVYLDRLKSKVNDNLYLIRIEVEGAKWYFFDIELHNNYPVLFWVPRKAGAFKFRTEQMVEEFQSVYVAPRKSTIVRMKGI